MILSLTYQAYRLLFCLNWPNMLFVQKTLFGHLGNKEYLYLHLNLEDINSRLVTYGINSVNLDNSISITYFIFGGQYVRAIRSFCRYPLIMLPKIGLGLAELVLHFRKNFANSLVLFSLKSCRVCLGLVFTTPILSNTKCKAAT